ncbi:MAG: TonB-dependent receptor [Prevotella sp.]|jgi:hypothetical protein|nr:MAG: TonB-dependent receptor [Prevotella sp.]
MKKNLSIIVFFVLASTQLFAQQIKGKIVDEHNSPMPFVNVVLLSKVDSAFVKGTMTDNEGCFILETSCNDGIVKLSRIGYQTIYKRCNGNDMDIIKMEESNTELRGVTVKGKRPTVKVGINTITVDVTHSYLRYLGKATDILGKIPGLTTDLQLLEGGSPTFVLNGKEASKKELAAIPSSEIKTIVVDTNPTAEYSASNKGVVYITTKTEMGDMLSSEVSNTSIFARHYMNMVNTTINERCKKVSNLLSVGFSYINTTQIDKTTETVFLPLSTIASAKERHTHGKGKILDWFYSMNWDINKHQSFGIQYTGNTGTTNIDEPTRQIKNEDEMVFSQRKNEKEHMHSISIYHNNKLDSTRKLSFIADYTFRHSDNTGFADAIPTVSTSSAGDYHIAGAVLSYSSYRKWAKLSAGVFFSTMSNKGEYAYNTDVEKYNTHENLFGAYLSLSKRLKGLYLQGGVRMEADHRKLDTNTSGIFTDSTEWRLFPNLIMKQTLTKKSSISLSVGQTIKRPSFGDLNPGLYYYDAISYKVGNPQVKPSITTNIKLSFKYSNLLTSVAYNKTLDKIIELPIWTEKSKGNKNIMWKPMNFKKASNVVATAIYYLSFGPIQGDVTGSFTLPHVKANYLGEEHVWNTPSWYIATNLQCPLSNHSLVALNGYFNSGGTGTITEHECSWTMNITYMHRLLKDKLTLVVAFNDIFHTDSGNNWTMKYNNLKTTMYTNGDMRQLMLKLSYNLGKLELDNSKKTASKELLNRL